MSVLRLERHRPQAEYLRSAVLLSSRGLHSFRVTQASRFTIFSNVVGCKTKKLT